MKRMYRADSLEELVSIFKEATENERDAVFDSPLYITLGMDDGGSLVDINQGEPPDWVTE